MYNRSKFFVLLFVVIGGVLTFGRAENTTARQHGGGGGNSSGHDVAANLQPTHAAFAGEWQGQLEYRDYSNNKRVKLPTLLDVSASPDGASLVFRYTYDDGPGKTVKSVEIVSIDLAGNKFVFVSEGGKDRTEYKVDGLGEFSEKHRGTLLLTGAGVENDQPVEVRKTITVADKTLTVLKETKPAGGAFSFRNQYTFTRVDKTASE